jgi:hypothetical protein
MDSSQHSGLFSSCIEAAAEFLAAVTSIQTMEMLCLSLGATDVASTLICPPSDKPLRTRICPLIKLDTVPIRMMLTVHLIDVSIGMIHVPQRRFARYDTPFGPKIHHA